MMKICILVTNIFGVGGCERVTVNLANAFCHKYNVHLISVFNRENRIKEELDKRVKVYYIVKGEMQLRYCYNQACKNINRKLREIQPDITLFINASTYIFLPVLRGIRTKSIACEHTNLNNKFHTSSILKKIVRAYAAATCDKIVTLTREDMINYQNKYRLKRNKVTYIYNWIEPEIFDNYKIQDGENKRILSVGRFDRVKGYELLVEVAYRLMKKNEDWQWHIYGSGDENYQKEIEALILEKGLQERLIIKRPETTIYQRYPEYSLLVLTSYYEGLPMVLLEAKACGLPIVAFECPTGPSEIIINDRNGYLVPCYDVEKMVNCIESLIRDASKIQEFSQFAHDNIYKFDKENILERWDNLFEELVEERTN